ncbi:hypothetical protein Tco_0218911 [Tanacetum coccineum]
MDNKLGEAINKAIQAHNLDCRKEAQDEKNAYIELLDTFCKSCDRENVTKLIEAAVLTRSSSQPTSTYEAAESLSEFELTKILIDKMEKNKSYDKANYKKKLFDALVESYNTDKDLFDSYGEIFSLKRSRDERDKDQDPSVGSDRGTKIRKLKEPSHIVEDSGMQQDQEFITGNNDDQPADKEVTKADCQVARAEEPPTSFDELNDTSFDLSAFVINRLKIPNLTQEILVGPTFNLLKGTCKSITELECHLEECSKATTKRLDWHNPENKPYPFDLRKPHPLIQDHQGRQIIPQGYFINKDLEYLKGEDLSRRYLTSVTKTKAATYDLKWIEDLVPNLWSPVTVKYDKHAYWGTSHWGPKRQRFYGFAANMSSSKDIEVRQEDQKLYKFREGYFSRHRLQDIEDMLLLLVQKKLTNLTIDQRLRLWTMASFDDTKNWDGEHTNSPMISNYKLKIGDEFLKILQDNAFNGMNRGDVTNHIAKDNALNGMNGGDVTNHIARVLEITEWIKMPNVEKNELRLHVFSKSLIGDAETWEYSPIPIPTRHDIDNPDDLCRTEEFTVVRHLIGDDEEFVTVGPSKINTVERTPGSMSCIYHELLNRKDRRWEECFVKISKKAQNLELKRRHLMIADFLTNTPYPTKGIRRISASTSQENAFDQFPIRRIALLPYAVSMKITIRRYGLRMMSRLSLKNDMPLRDKYLKGTPSLGLWYLKCPGFDLKGYSDSDYVGCNMDRKSTSGACQLIGGKLVCWSAKKQQSVAMSSVEAEYVAAAGCCANILCMKSQLTDYDIIYEKVPIFCDNTSAIAISNNPVLHSRTKHIDIRYHFIRDHILKGDIELHFIHTQYQLADIFTKPLDEPTFKKRIVELVLQISLSKSQAISQVK